MNKEIKFLHSNSRKSTMDHLLLNSSDHYCAHKDLAPFDKTLKLSSCTRDTFIFLNHGIKKNLYISENNFFSPA